MKVHSKENLYGEYTVPSDKSITSRAISLGSIAKNKTYIIDPHICEDTNALINCARKLGAKVRLKGRILEIRGTKKIKSGLRFDCGNSGTTLRFMCGITAGSGVEAVLTGGKLLLQREMYAIKSPIEKMGAGVSLARGGVPPVLVSGRSIRAIDYPLNTASSQIKSAILLCALVGGVKATINEVVPTRNHMEILMRNMGVDVTKDEQTGVITLEKSELKGSRIFVCRDFSVAMNFIALGLLCGQTTCKNIGINPTRTEILSVLKRMGAKIEIKNRRILCGEPIADIIAYKSKLKPTHVSDGEIIKMSDELPILAVLMGVAEGESIISGVGKVQYKDVDRMGAIRDMINSIGGECADFDGGLVIRGVDRYKGGFVKTFGDSRLAMSAIIALTSSVNGGETDDDSCINTDFPGFFECLKKNSFVRLGACVPNDDVNEMHDFNLGKLKVKNYTFSYLNPIGGVRKTYVEAKDYDGFTVGSPYKGEVAKRLTRLEKKAKFTKNVNVVKDMEGFSIDGIATVYAIKNKGVDLVGKKVLVYGCGTTAKNVIMALCEEKAAVTVYNRTSKVSNEFKRKFSWVTVKEKLTDDMTFDVIINSTPVGSGCLAGMLPVSEKMIEKCGLIVDMVIIPENTQLIKTAKIIEVPTITGNEIAFYVAYLSDCVFADVEPSVEQSGDFYREYFNRSER